ncbi:MAG: TldD/PmbA family protein [bacterium]
MDNKFFLAHLCYGDYGTIFIEDSELLSINWENGKLENIQSGADKGLGIHIQSGDESYYSHQNTVDAGSLDKIVSSLIPRNKKKKQLTKPIQEEKAFSHPVKIKANEIELNSKIGFLKDVNGYIASSDSKIKQVVIRYGEKNKKIKVISSDGCVSSEIRDYVVVFVSVIAADQGDIQTATEVVGGIGGFELIRETDWKTISKRLASLVINKLSAPYLPAREMPVVLSSEAGGTMIHEAIGHNLEADAVQKGISPHFANKKGKKVANELVSIVDDPTLAGKRGSYFIDDEGVIAQKTVLVENGLLKDYLYDRYTALKDKRESNAHGRRESFQTKPIPRMANTFILPGSSSPSDIVRSLKDGLLVKKMGGGQVNTATGDFVFEVEEGYLVKEGKPQNLVRGATLLGNGPQVLLDIDMVGNDMGWGIGTCGKEGQGVPVSDGQPTLRIKNILVGGSSESK